VVDSALHNVQIYRSGRVAASEHDFEVRMCLLRLNFCRKERVHRGQVNEGAEEFDVAVDSDVMRLLLPDAVDDGLVLVCSSLKGIGDG
jgi:hypothetical protein